MDIKAKKGTKVIYTGKNGYDHDIEHANKFLIVNRAYTVHHTDIQGWRTDVFLCEFPGKYFNSVHFEDANLSKIDTPESAKVLKHKETIQTVMEFVEYLNDTGTAVNETDIYDWLNIDHDKYLDEIEEMIKQ